MCGICAIYGSNNRVLINAMGKKLLHRGPDDYGVYSGERVTIGHRRLSIIDVKGGKQPIFNEAKDKCIVCNGEIYNFKELRKNLMGHTFSTKSDTEVILHLYEDMGAELLHKLNGMFAFIIYDNGEIFAARDRIGIKPLYYGYSGSNIIFASEVKALKGCENISEFPPGHYYTSREGFKEYYKLSSVANELRTNDEEEICGMIRENLFESVKRRLVSDVPVGVFLSGGIDSSIIAALMNPYVDILYSFAVGSEGSEDLEASRMVAEFLKTKHIEYIYTEKDVMNEMENIIYHLESFDAPLVRSAIPNYFVSRAARGHVKVVLSGEGSDELFSGYHYLKDFKKDEELEAELIRITKSLHNINLQRTDRMTMAHSIEARVPFLDHEFVDFAMSIPIAMRKATENRMEKYILRKAFEEYLPAYIVWRKKVKFSEGSGFEDMFNEIAEKRISDKVYNETRNNGGRKIRAKDELYFYKLYQKHFSFCGDNCLAGVTSDI
jgi:asparagine synthase (glutamine-hydrolysing)